MNALTAAQQAQTCPSCTADPNTAPARYCASSACRCAHPDCPAFASYAPLRDPLANVEHLPTRKANPSTWADREESTWIDSM